MAGVARLAGFRRAARGAVFGAASGLVYAACELGLGVGLPARIVEGRGVPGLRVGTGALLLGAYAALGALAGAAVGWGLRRASARQLAAGATLVLVAAHGAALIGALPPSPGLALALAACGAAALPLAQAVRGRRGRFEAAAGPWPASLAVVGAAAIALDLAPATGLPVACSAAWLGAVLGAAWLWGPRPRDPSPGLLVAGLAALSAVAGLALASRSPPPLPAVEAAPPRAERPHIVLVTLDTLRSDHLSVYGYERETSPELGALAAEATLYRAAVASSDLTLSTHASLFTGLYARHHGARPHEGEGPRGLAPRFETLAEALGPAGYLGLAVVANHNYLAAHYGLAQGFRHYDDRRPLPPVPRLPAGLLARWLGRALAVAASPFGGLGAGEVPYRRAEEINASVFRLLDRFGSAGPPLFLFVNYVDPHWPYAPPPPFDARFPGRGEFELPPADYLRHRRLPRLDPALRAHLISQYDGEIAYLDAQLGRLFARLRRLGLWDRSLLVVTSDHGEAFGEHGLVLHGVSVHEHQVAVPLLIKAPGQREARVVEERVGTVDLMPTILDAARLPVPEGLAGTSLLRPGPWRREILAESHPDPFLSQVDPRFRRTQRALYRGSLKLVASTPGEVRLFDLASDPGELGGAGRDPRIAALQGRLDRWLGMAGHAPGEPVEMAEEARDRLRALGYAR